MNTRQTRTAFSRTPSLNLLLGSLALVAATAAPLAQAGELDASPVTHSVATRAQIRAELAQALHDGNVVVDNQTGRTAREIDPSSYPQPARAELKTRREVRAETLQAIRKGELLESETGRRLNEVNPGRYHHAATPAADEQVAVLEQVRNAL